MDRTDLDKDLLRLEETLQRLIQEKVELENRFSYD